MRVSVIEQHKSSLEMIYLNFAVKSIDRKMKDEQSR